MNGDRPLSTVLHDIAGNFQHIVRSELRLAKTELHDELGKTGSAAAMLGAGAIALWLTVLFALLAVVYALSEVMPAWGAALIVAGSLGLIALVCVAVGKQTVD